MMHYIYEQDTWKPEREKYDEFIFTNAIKEVDEVHTGLNDPIEKKYVYIIGRVYENVIRNIGYSVLKLVHQWYGLVRPVYR